MLAARKKNLSNARARKNKHTARMLADARNDHSIPLLNEKSRKKNNVLRYRICGYGLHHKKFLYCTMMKENSGPGTVNLMH